MYKLYKKYVMGTNTYNMSVIYLNSQNNTFLYLFHILIANENLHSYEITILKNYHNVPIISYLAKINLRSMSQSKPKMNISENLEFS